MDEGSTDGDREGLAAGFDVGCLDGRFVGTLVITPDSESWGTVGCLVGKRVMPAGPHPGVLGCNVGSGVGVGSSRSPSTCCKTLP